MASGAKAVVINTQERAVSVDINRLQAFADAAIAERLRYGRNVSQGTDDLDASGLNLETVTLGTPLSAEIEGGLEVQPQIATLQVNVSPGVLMALAPDGSETPAGLPAIGDSSPYKYVRDVGTQALTMTTNSSGQIRIDVIECSVVNVISETDNRDIFNPSSGLFAATTVTKAVQAALNYRVRLGTPGSGFPGFSSGWLPLAVAIVPNGTATCDQVTFYDVRPLVEDRIFAPSNLSRDFSKVHEVHALIDTASFGGKAVLEGHADCNATNLIDGIPGLYRLGGRLRTGAPVADIVNAGGGLPDGLDLNDAHNQAGTWSNGTPVYVYLLEPFLLPRWARYSDASTGVRKPRSPRGIIMVSPIAPKSFYGCPSSPITLPATMGFGSVTANKGVCILAAVGGAGQTVGALVADGKMQFSPTGFAATLAGTTTGTTSTYFALVEGTHYPANAKAIIVSFACAISGSGSPNIVLNPQVQVVAGSGGTPYWSTPAMGGGGPYSQFINAIEAPTFGMTIRIPILPKYPSDLSGSTQLQILWNATVIGGAWAVGATGIQVVGWEF